MQANHQQNPQTYQSFIVHPQQVQNVFPFRNMQQESDQLVSFLDCSSIGEKWKNSTSDDDRLNAHEEGIVGHSEGGREKKEAAWQRVKWTDKMVKLLITAISYLGDDSLSDCSGGRRSALHSLKKGKWKAISKVMAERGYHVSPQQCEDKFNDLNKRYKRLNDIIGTGTCCKVVENSALLDLMDLSEKAKGDVRKILNSKQLFYQEMCSYHNGNRLYLPHDWVLQQSLQSVRKSGDSCDPHEARSYKPGELDEENDSDGRNDDNDGEERALQLGKRGASVLPGISATRKKQMEEHESTDLLGYNKRSDPYPPNDLGDVNRVFTEAGEREQLLKRWMISRSLQLKEQKLQIQAQMFELEEQRSKWLMFSQIEDRQLDKMKLANECLKLENEHLALELKRRQR